MTWFDPAEAVATANGTIGQHGGRVPRGADAIYLLVYNDPRHPTADHRPGWNLIAWQGDDRCLSIDLTRRGVTPDTPTDEGMTLAEQVLDAAGVRTSGWRRNPPRLAVPRQDRRVPKPGLVARS